jgi:hypothetical protein
MGDLRLIRSVARGDHGRKFDGSGANEMPWCVETSEAFAGPELLGSADASAFPQVRPMNGALCRRGRALGAHAEL